MTKDYASGSDKRCPTAKQFREIFTIFRYPRTADVRPVVLDFRKHEKRDWHDHLFAERSDSLPGVAIRGAIVRGTIC